jgi:hypothetical protein
LLPSTSYVKSANLSETKKKQLRLLFLLRMAPRAPHADRLVWTSDKGREKIGARKTFGDNITFREPS